MAEQHSPVPVAARGFQGRPAGVVTRLLAASVDLLVVLIALAALYGGIAAVAFMVHPSSFHWPSRLGWSIPFIGFVIVLPYLALAWHATGRTYGDALLGLRVVGRDGRRLRLPTALLRALLCILFPIGLFWAAVNRNNRSAQDIVVRSSVIYDWTPAPPAA